MADWWSYMYEFMGGVVCITSICCSTGAVGEAA